MCKFFFKDKEKEEMTTKWDHGETKHINHVTISTPSKNSSSESQLLSKTKIVGEVALTPTNRSFTPQVFNPHSSMVAITPMASAASQVKSSIKLQ